MTLGMNQQKPHHVPTFNNIMESVRTSEVGMILASEILCGNGFKKYTQFCIEAYHKHTQIPYKTYQC